MVTSIELVSVVSCELALSVGALSATIVLVGTVTHLVDGNDHVVSSCGVDVVTHSVK